MMNYERWKTGDCQEWVPVERVEMLAAELAREQRTVASKSARIRELEAELANYKGAVDALQARIAVLKPALHDLLALADISQPSPDLVPGVVRRARAAVDAWFEEQDRLPTDGAEMSEPETAWLIETTHGPTLYYSKTGFCSVASHGERFPTREAAEAVAKIMRTPTRVVEHQWG